MRRAAPRRQGTNRNIGFERQAAKLGMDQLLHELNDRRRDEEVHGPALQVRRALKLADKIRVLEPHFEHEKVIHAKMAEKDPEKAAMWFEAYERHMPIHIDNTAWKKAMKHLGLSRRQMLLLVQFPNEFPNVRLVYSYFNNTHWITWDGKA